VRIRHSCVALARRLGSHAARRRRSVLLQTSSLAPDPVLGGRARGSRGGSCGRTAQAGGPSVRRPPVLGPSLASAPPASHATRALPRSSLHERYGRSTSGTPPSLAPAPPLNPHDAPGDHIRLVAQAGLERNSLAGTRFIQCGSAHAGGELVRQTRRTSPLLEPRGGGARRGGAPPPANRRPLPAAIPSPAAYRSCGVVRRQAGGEDGGDGPRRDSRRRSRP
jgi:hypothetical protein